MRKNINLDLSFLLNFVELKDRLPLELTQIQTLKWVSATPWHVRQD